MPDEPCNFDLQKEHSLTIQELSLRVEALEISKGDHRAMDHRVAELERTVDVMGERTKHYESKIDLMEKSIQVLTEKQEALKERMPSRDEWNNLKTAVDSLQGKGGRTFDRIKDLILAAIVSGTMAYFLLKILEQIAPKGGTP